MLTVLTSDNAMSCRVESVADLSNEDAKDKEKDEDKSKDPS